MFRPASPPPSHWTEPLRSLLLSSSHWRIYVDGFLSPMVTHHWVPAAWRMTHARGCIVGRLNASWSSRLRDQGWVPSNLIELLAITGGLQILAQLNLAGSVLSYCGTVWPFRLTTEPIHGWLPSPSGLWTEYVILTPLPQVGPGFCSMWYTPYIVYTMEYSYVSSSLRV